MQNILEKICTDKREHIAKQKAKISEAALRDEIKSQSAVRGFKSALVGKISGDSIEKCHPRPCLRRGKPLGGDLKPEVKKDSRLRGNDNQYKTALIAEIKKASPSKGLIRSDFDVVSIAKAYQAGGAACISVLTDIPYFQGADEYLALARNAVSIPILRKDFMLDSYQIVESRVLGADCILLIMAALSDAQAQELEICASALDMDVLVEVHDMTELERALKINPNNAGKIIGVNNRNLKTLEINLSTSETLAKYIPEEYIGVCESGIYTKEDIARMHTCGLHAFLVGESLMKQDDIEKATRELLIRCP